MFTKSPFIRLAPLQFEDLPPHPSIPTTTNNTKPQPPRPDLLPFVLTLLDQARTLLHPTTFNLTFKHHSAKPSPPSNNEVEILSAELSTSQLTSGIPWSTPSCPRSKPTKLHDEYWYARRSYHHNLSVKRNAPGTASFNEFIYGLRDEKSKREAQFTSDLYDAHHICDWNDELSSLLSSSNTTTQKHTYSHTTLTLHEMCHKLPSPASPRCFPVLVLTASVSSREFLAVTLPVDITRFPAAFYSTGRNQREGTDHQIKKAVTIGAYVAVEKVIRYVSTSGTNSKDPATAAAAVGKDGKHERERSIARGASSENQREEIEWVMATASRAKGNIPMAVQRMGVPGAIAKDVGLFLKWIRNVPEEEIAKVRNASEEDGGVSGNGSSGLRREVHAEPQSAP